jgi:triosephosphate isomerase
MRTPLIVANWKMHKTLEGLRSFFEVFLPAVEDVKDREVVVCPPAIYLQEVSQLTRGRNVSVGCQDIHWELEGAYTGDISLSMVREFCQWVIVGHSERRRYHDESDETVNKKARLALSQNFRTIICIGETKEQRDTGQTEQVVESQLTKALEGVQGIGKVTIAYEPVWAIGTGVNEPPEEVEHVHKLVRKVAQRLYGDAAEALRILYGGSVKPENIKTLMQCEDIDGCLVGNASLEPESFAAIVKF